MGALYDDERLFIVPGTWVHIPYVIIQVEGHLRKKLPSTSLITYDILPHVPSTLINLSLITIVMKS